MAEVEKIEKAEKVEKVERTDGAREDKITPESPAKKPLPLWLMWAGAGLALLLIAGASYFMGFSIGRNAAAPGGLSDSTMRGGMNKNGSLTPGGMPGSGRMQSSGTTGEVTAVSDTSITISDTMRGGSVTYEISSDTTVKDSNGDEQSVSEIAKGDTVRVTVSNSDTTVAATIIISDTSDATASSANTL